MVESLVCMRMKHSSNVFSGRQDTLNVGSLIAVDIQQTSTSTLIPAWPGEVVIIRIPSVPSVACDPGKRADNAISIPAKLPTYQGESEVDVPGHLHGPGSGS